MAQMAPNLNFISSYEERNYYIYILDNGYSDPLTQVIKENFQNFATQVARNNSIIIIGIGEIGLFDKEVLAWHKINGDDFENLFPAILITKTNPHRFKQFTQSKIKENKEEFSYILIPLKKLCKTGSEVLDLMRKIIKDIENQSDLNDFKIQKELKPNVRKGIFKSLILEPNFSGIGFSFNKLNEYLK
jgi:uncharacterized FAD-dependent dehydrogenase